MTTLDERPATGPGGGPDPAATTEVSFDTSPERYRHWTLTVDGEIATLTLDVAEDGGIVSGYELKMNSYDLGVDIELHDAVQRIRFEHPEVRAVVVTSGKERMFCAGANIKMLAASPHSWKVNFCKFTNETRNGIEDASASSGLPFLAAVNGSAAGGGYELALACDQILLVDDNSSAVSLPEVPLLGVLPGTGGLTRVVDKRGVRRDLADVFATTAEGVRGERAVRWRLVDAVAKARDFPAEVARRAAELAATSTRPGAGATGVRLTPLRREVDGDTTRYAHVHVVLDRDAGTAAITVLGPDAVPGSVEELHGQGDAAWLLAVSRELDDVVLRLRTNEPAIGTWLLRTEGDLATAAAYDEFLLAHRDDWLVAETIAFYRRVVKRLDTTSRSLFALIEPGSCSAGALAELALAADRQYMLEGTWEDMAEDGDEAPPPAAIRLDAFNTGLLPMGNGLTRLQVRFLGSAEELAAAEAAAGRDLLAAEAAKLGLVTSTPDDIDWDDEIRLAVEERASFSPDALTGMEANLRFAGRETQIALAADRQYMLEGTWEDMAEDGDEAPPPAAIRLDAFNTGLLPMGNGLTRLQVRFLGSAEELAAAEAAAGRDLLAAEAAELGLVTSAPDDIDWDDEIRLAVEERASFSPDALTGMEANLRFAGRETPETKVFGRLTAWQNWIFQRPNAAGPEGALRRYGTGQRADYDRKRV